jgi:hypothetical protein
LATSPPAFDALQIESGAHGRNIELLGRRLREAIRRQELEPELLQAVEWTLDRHHTRAIRHLKEGMAADEQLTLEVSSLFRHLSGSVDSGGMTAGQNGTLTSQRVARIIGAISPGLLRASKIQVVSMGELGEYLPCDSEPAGPRRPARSVGKPIPGDVR